MNKHHLLLISTLAASLMVSSLSHPAHAEESALESGFNVGYHSKYLAHGREDFDGGGGIFTAELGTSYDGYAVALWYAESDNTDANETNLILSKEWAGESFSASIAYVYLSFGGAQFESEELDDHELEIVASCEQCLPLGLTPEFGLVYSDGAEGHATWLSIARTIESPKATTTLYALVELDEDYNSPEYDGLNHYEYGVSVDVPIDDATEFNFYVTHTISSEDIRQDIPESDKLTVAGFSFSFNF